MSENDGGFGGFGGVSVGKQNQPVPNRPKSNENKPNENLSAALRASLRIVESSSDGSEPIPSPLSEATPDSVDILLDRINTHMIEGKILSDADLRLAIDMYRSQALRYAQEQENKKPRTPRGTKSTLKAVLDLDFDELE